MNTLKNIWDFPAHHVSLGWWIAIAVGVWPLFRFVLAAVRKAHAAWNRQFQASQLTAKIWWLEHLHNNTNGLMRYLAREAVDIAIEICFVLTALGLSLSYLFWSKPSLTLPTGAILLGGCCLNLASTVLGRAWRVRTLLNDLHSYEVNLAKLKDKLARLQR